MKNLNLNIAPKKSDKKDYPYDYSHAGLGIIFVFKSTVK
jgi:hypothetical protein